MPRQLYKCPQCGYIGVMGVHHYFTGEVECNRCTHDFIGKEHRYVSLCEKLRKEREERELGLLDEFFKRKRR